MDRKRMIYIGLAVMSGGGLLIDRLFLSEPESASAEMTNSSLLQQKRLAAQNKLKTNPDTKTDPSLAWLNKLDESQYPRNVFTPSTAMLAHYKQLEQASEDQKAKQRGPQPGSPEAFRAEHKLQCTSIGKGAALAIINGKMLRVGDKIDGYRIKSIKPYRVELSRKRDKVILSLPVPTATP